MLMWESLTGWINQLLAYMGGCFGCYTKSTPITSVDEPSKGLQTPWPTVKRASVSEDFWSTSTHDLENSALTALANLNLDGGTGATSQHSEFVNNGLIEWNRTRLQWAASKRSDINPEPHKPKLSWNESLLGSRRFTRAVALSEMVEYLVDIWEHEGLYD